MAQTKKTVTNLIPPTSPEESEDNSFLCDCWTAMPYKVFLDHEGYGQCPNCQINYFVDGEGLIHRLDNNEDGRVLDTVEFIEKKAGDLVFSKENPIYMDVES